MFLILDKGKIETYILLLSSVAVLFSGLLIVDKGEKNTDNKEFSNMYNYRLANIYL